MNLFFLGLDAAYALCVMASAKTETDTEKINGQHLKRP